MRRNKKNGKRLQRKLQAFSVCEKMVKSICYEDKGVICVSPKIGELKIAKLALLFFYYFTMPFD